MPPPSAAAELPEMRDDFTVSTQTPLVPPSTRTPPPADAEWLSVICEPVMFTLWENFTYTPPPPISTAVAWLPVILLPVTETLPRPLPEKPPPLPCEMLSRM